MDKKKRIICILIFTFAAIILFIGTILVKSPGGHGSAGELMRDAVLHEANKISLFGLKAVNPGLISAFTVTGVLFVFALIVRIFVIPRFKIVPGRLQLLLEALVGFFDSLAKANSPHRNKFLGAYIFAAGVYIFTGTIFELFGFQAVTTHGGTVTLPAPLADINGAIMMGSLSYLVIMSGGIAENKIKGIGLALKEFSLPVSMSFRLFGALLSGTLVTELVYHYIYLSYGLPVVVGVLFTLMHALIQSYVLVMLTSLFYGEVSEPHENINFTEVPVMKGIIKRVFSGLPAVFLLLALAAPAMAAETEAVQSSVLGSKALAAAIAVGIAAAAGAVGMGIAIAKAAEGISRQPEAESKIRTTLMLGLVFVETAIIYALVIGILIIFVL